MKTEHNDYRTTDNGTASAKTETQTADSGHSRPGDGGTETVNLQRQSRNLKHADWATEVEPCPEAVEAQALLDDLAGTLKRFVVLPSWAPETLALWVLHTYAFELRDVSTYLGIESPEKRCGKTTLLTVLSRLVNRPVLAANISSPPAFFRVIEETRPTLLIDEADTLLQGNDELRGILNSGYSRSAAFVVRVGNGSRDSETTDSRTTNDGGQWSDRSRLVRYSCWCPKVIAAIGRLPETLEDRCIVIRMQRKLTGEPCDRLRNLEPDAIRAKCARFVKDHSQSIAQAQPEIPASLNDRAADIWEPLLALADLAGPRWGQTARKSAEALTAGAQEGSPMGSLLLDIFVVLAESEAGRVRSRELVDRLMSFQNRPWAELLPIALRPFAGQGRLDGVRSRLGRATELWVARQLRPYGVRPRTLRIAGEIAKGYSHEDFGDLFRRYIPKSEVEELRATVMATDKLTAENAENADKGGP